MRSLRVFAEFLLKFSPEQLELLEDIKTFMRRNLENVKKYSLNNLGFIGSHWHKRDSMDFDCVAHVSGLNLLLSSYALLQ